MRRMRRWLEVCFCAAGVSILLALVSGCTTIDAAPSHNLDKNAKWVVLPFSNATETPLAGQRAEAIVFALVQSFGVSDIQRYPQSMQDETLLEPGQGQGRSQDQVLAWAKGVGARFALTGTVQEWRYKVGVDGEPAVGISLQIVDLDSGKVVWTGVGAKSGWSRESLAAVAQNLLKKLMVKAF